MHRKRNEILDRHCEMWPVFFLLVGSFSFIKNNKIKLKAKHGSMYKKL